MPEPSHLPPAVLFFTHFLHLSLCTRPNGGSENSSQGKSGSAAVCVCVCVLGVSVYSVIFMCVSSQTAKLLYLRFCSIFCEVLCTVSNEQPIVFTEVFESCLEHHIQHITQSLQHTYTAYSNVRQENIRSHGQKTNNSQCINQNIHCDI